VVGWITLRAYLKMLTFSINLFRGYYGYHGDPGNHGYNGYCGFIDYFGCCRYGYQGYLGDRCYAFLNV
jgi:hypothetical protein